MGRNSELIRQWTLLQQLAAVRTNTIPNLSTDLKVSTRTVRRDLEALQMAGFPIYDETVDGTKFWRMDPTPAGAMARSGLTFSELCALYFSRALLESFASTALLRDLHGALDKFEPALSGKVQLRFHPQIAASIKERTWHASQQFKDRSDSSVVMTLEVSDDYALRSWILGFGRLVRVVTPAHLVDWVQEELDQAREQYASGDHARVADSDVQPSLPYLFNRLASA